MVLPSPPALIPGTLESVLARTCPLTSIFNKEL